MIAGPVLLIFLLQAVCSGLGCSDGEFLPNEENCHSFFKCDHGRPVPFQCGPGTAWSQSILTCDHTYMVPECNKAKKEPQPGSDKSDNTDAPEPPAETTEEVKEVEKSDPTDAPEPPAETNEEVKEVNKSDTTDAPEPPAETTEEVQEDGTPPESPSDSTEDKPEIDIR